MEFLHSLFINIVPFVIILSILVFFHELGHYLVAKWNGVKIEVFSIGFGPEIFGWTDQSETRWKISWIPLGGYVRMFSDLNAASQPDQDAISQMSEEDKAKSLFHKSVWQRIAVSVAGPLANYLLAITIFAFIYAISGQRMPDPEPSIGFVAPASPADVAGLKAGDKVISVNDTPIQTFEQFQEFIVNNPGHLMKLEVLRDNSSQIINATPSAKEINGKKVGRLGLQQNSLHVQRNPLSALYYAVYDVINISYKTLESVGRIIIRKESADGLSGPIGIATTIGQFAEKSWTDLIWVTAFLSLNLGLINLLPIPMLDGGHLLFYFIEAIRGKPVSEKAQEIGFRIGAGVLMILILITTWNDLSRFKFFMYIRNLLS